MKKKVYLKGKSNPSQVLGKSDKIFANYVGDKIGKILSPTDKITPICKWVSGYM